MFPANPRKGSILCFRVEHIKIHPLAGINLEIEKQEESFLATFPESICAKLKSQMERGVC